MQSSAITGYSCQEVVSPQFKLDVNFPLFANMLELCSFHCEAWNLQEIEILQLFFWLYWKKTHLCKWSH